MMLRSIENLLHYLAMLHEYVENSASVDIANNVDENEINEIIASGMSKTIGDSKFPLGTIHEAIQTKVQEIIRLGEVANEQRTMLKDEVLSLKSVISKMEKEMGENARIKNDNVSWEYSGNLTL